MFSSRGSWIDLFASLTLAYNESRMVFPLVGQLTQERREGFKFPEITRLWASLVPQAASAEGRTYRTSAIICRNSLGRWYGHVLPANSLMSGVQICSCTVM